MLPRNLAFGSLLFAAVSPLALSAQPAVAGEIEPPVSQRFARGGDVAEASAAERTAPPDFRRHVLPLLGRVGCNGRGCHGSFQGQGGFRLSLFGYDLEADHAALAGGEQPRVDRAHPAESLILEKPTLAIDHEGGRRFERGGWEYRLLLRWIESGAKAEAAVSAELSRLEVLPTAIRFDQPGQTQQLTVIAHWSDGAREDVTCLTRFRTNDESVATIDAAGAVSCVSAGDTHVVAFYDNNVTPVPVVTPVGPLTGDRYPAVSAPTDIDRLVVAKLRDLGVVPSELCGDAEFLRRVSLDVTGTLPLAEEIESFLADSSPDKRERKIDELLSRPTYAAWWTTRLCDYTGNNSEQLKEGAFEGQRTALQWYTWIYERVAENRPYDEIAAGIILGAGRPGAADYDDYCRTMNRCFGDETGHEFAARDTLPHYWMRRDRRKPEQMAEAFAHTFLGIRLQCAQCHKHPFDQWTKRDYDEFAAVFRRVRFGVAPDAKRRADELQALLNEANKGKVDFGKQTPQLIAAGQLIPWREVFAAPPARPKRAAGTMVEPARLLEGDKLDLSVYDDPRQPLVSWLRRDPERYFARALVNRVWAAYFHRGIVEPPDDLSRANPPANGPLLDYLTHQFVEHRFDLKWLHRAIATSRTYQSSWQPNDTNRLDLRNFSRAVPRRLPAEVAYNAILQATARSEQVGVLHSDPQQLATGPAQKSKLPKANYALAVFGRPTRATTCDCERNDEPTLLQTLYLQNDNELFGLLDRSDGWVQQIARQRGAVVDTAALEQRRIAREQDVSEVERQLAGARAGDEPRRVQQLEKRRKGLEQQLSKLSAQLTPARESLSTAGAEPLDHEQFVRQAYLRTVSRPPQTAELARAVQYLRESSDERRAIRDLVWALVNTKEFILNH